MSFLDKLAASDAWYGDIAQDFIKCFITKDRCEHYEVYDKKLCYSRCASYDVCIYFTDTAENLRLGQIEQGDNQTYDNTQQYCQ